VAAGIDGARLMKVARLRTENGNGTALKIWRSFWKKPRGLKEKIRKSVLGEKGTRFWQLKMVEADRAKANSGWWKGKEARGREGLCFWGEKTEGKRGVRSSVAESSAMFVIFRCV